MKKKKKKTVNIYIVYELAGSSSHSDNPTLQNRLFGAVTLTKNADIDKYSYAGYRIVFYFLSVDLVKMY